MLKAKPTVSFDPTEFTINIEPFDGAWTFTVWVRQKNVTHAHTVLESDMFPASPNNTLTWIKLWDFTPKHHGRLVAGEYEACVIAINEKLDILGDEASVTFSLSDEQCARIASEYADKLESATPSEPLPDSAATPTVQGTRIETARTVTAPTLPGPPSSDDEPEEVAEVTATPTATSVAPGRPANFKIAEEVILEWDPVQEAEMYTFAVSRYQSDPQTRTEPVPGLVSTTEDTGIDLERAIQTNVLTPTQSYKLTVIASNKDNVQGEAGSFDFHVSNGVLQPGACPVARTTPLQPQVTPPVVAPHTQEIARLQAELRATQDAQEQQRRELTRAQQDARDARTELNASRNAVQQTAEALTDSLRQSTETIARLRQELAQAHTARTHTPPPAAEPAPTPAPTPARAPEARPAEPTPARTAGGGRGTTARARTLAGISWWMMVLCAVIFVALILVLTGQIDFGTGTPEDQASRDTQMEIIRKQDEENKRRIDAMARSVTSSPTPSPTSPLPARHTLSSLSPTNMSLTLPSNDSDRAANASINLMGNTFGDEAQVHNRIEINDNRTTYVHPDGWPKGWEPTLPQVVAGRELKCGIHTFILDPRDVQRICILPGWYIEPAMEDLQHVDVKRGTDTTQQDHLIGKTNEVVDTKEFRLRPKAHEYATVTVRILVRPLSGCTCPGGHH